MASDSTLEITQNPWEILEELAESRNADSLKAECERLGTRETARALSRLDGETRSVILGLLDAESAAHLVEEMSDAQAVEIIDQLGPAEAAGIIEEMESSEAADILGEMDEERAAEIIGVMEPEAAEDARILTQYDSNVAGGLMVREYLAYPENYTVRQVLDDLRDNAEEYRSYEVQYAYVVTESEQLIGVLSLRDLLLQPGNKPIATVMKKSPVHVTDTDTLDELEHFFHENGFLASPVTDTTERLIGVVTREDVQEAFGERAEDVYLKTQGIVGGEELRSMSVYRRSSRRLAWLSANIVLNVIAASMIALYVDTLDAVIALAVFLPIISDMSGCSGNQAVAVSMRELTLGLIKPVDFLYVWIKELKVGLINGLALGLLIGVLAFLWKGNVYLSLVTGGALALNTLIAVSIGGLVPLVMKGFKLDPALASGPILTTITDLCGFFLVLSLATAMLPYLT